MAFKLSPENLFVPVSWLILLGSAGALSWSGYEIYNRHLKTPAPQEFNFGSMQKAAASERVGLDPVIQAHIFGVVPPKPAPEAEKPKIVEAPKTKLNLLLTGVITSPEPQGGVAMIEIQRGQTSVVRVGANIGKTGAKLIAVHSDHILIERQGKLEKLPIERDTLDLVALASSNEQTISSLNINVAEFEALAAVDPSETDISRLLPQRQQPQAPTGDDLGDANSENAGLAGDGNALDPDKLQEDQEKQREDQEIRQQDLLERQQREMERMQQLRQQQNNASAPQGEDSAGRKVRQQVPGGLKQI